MEKDIKSGLGEKLSDALVSRRLAEGILVPNEFVVSSTKDDCSAFVADALLADAKKTGLHKALENLASGSFNKSELFESGTKLDLGYPNNL